MTDPKTRRELAFQANQILKDDKKLSSESLGVNIDLLSAHDARRRSTRRDDLAVRNHDHLMAVSIASDFRMTPEDYLLEMEKRKKLEDILEDIFAKFQPDATAFEVLIQVLTFGESYRDSKRLAEILEVRVDDIRAAKQRISYYVTNTLTSPF